jgi:hypothetical protein
MPLPLWVVLWISLALLLLSLTLGLLHCFRTGRALWRDLKSFGSVLDGTVAALSEALAAAAEGGARFGAGAPRLDAAVAGLRGSWRRWSVLRAAVGDVRTSLVAVYPRK